MRLTQMKRRDYEKWIRQYGWYLSKGSIDWILRNEKGERLCTIKITHPGGEVPKHHVHLTKTKLKEQGLE